MKKLYAVCALVLLLVGCGKSEPTAAPSQNSTQIQSAPKKEVVINGMDLAYALWKGDDGNGKTKEVYFLEMEGNMVVLTKALIGAKDTNDSSVWYLGIGEPKVPKILCEQRSKEAKMLVANFTNVIYDATVVGEYDRVSDGKVYLKDCYLRK